MAKLKLSTKILVVLTGSGSILPYLIPYEWQYSFDPKTGQYIPTHTFDFLAPVAWVLLLVATLMVANWDRKLFWLFALIPVAFGPCLFTLYFAVYAWLFGFAP
jgi:hypothetical protein